jgi:hypothetical protein
MAVTNGENFVGDSYHLFGDKCLKICQERLRKSAK